MELVPTFDFYCLMDPFIAGLLWASLGPNPSSHFQFPDLSCKPQFSQSALVTCYEWN